MHEHLFDFFPAQNEKDGASSLAGFFPVFHQASGGFLYSTRLCPDYCRSKESANYNNLDNAECSAYCGFGCFPVVVHSVTPKTTLFG
jgi:hypothetical protein